MRNYFNKQANHWDEIACHNPLKLDIILGKLKLKAGHRVLDIGSGTGVLLKRLSSSVNPEGKIISLDIAENMLYMAKEKHSSLKILYLQGSGEELPLRDESCHRVICYSVFPHFKNQLKILGEIKRVLSPGGLMVIAHSESRDKINEIHSKLEGPVSKDYLPSGEEMCLLLEKQKFVIKDIIDNNEIYCFTAEKGSILWNFTPVT
ncbi:MAG TPA: methyltransferase domain-containing protein [Candidatus Eremiobacteraeota bacterium]|nr:MAG: Demethylmenaquinone methyltransferase [bacterium ADurb.Bin363]HPZ09269.1 methyltransferase domain-containing protein [Candidatus Eremiobacteraeota bacterium]